MTEPEHVRRARAVYDGSADRYLDAVGSIFSVEFEAPLDQALLAGFAETLRARAAGTVIDIGCGTGRAAAFLADRGLDVRGVDLSVRMVQLARQAHPSIRFDEGQLTSIPVATGAMGAAVSWYSIIATPPEQLPEVWTEFARVLAPGGDLLVAFQAGDNDRDERPDAYGTSNDFTLHRHRVEDVIDGLTEAGFVLRAQMQREPELDHETSPQAFVILRR